MNLPFLATAVLALALAGLASAEQLADDPGKAEELEVGYSPHAIAIDSQGNAWVANTLGEPSTREKLDLLRTKIRSELESRPAGGGDETVRSSSHSSASSRSSPAAVSA